MSREEVRAVKCLDCRADLPSAWARSADQPCTECGSRRRLVRLTHAEEMQVRECTEIRVKDSRYSSKKNPRVMLKQGASYWRDERKWMHREMHVDRALGRYREVVSDPETGEIVHECEEPLSKHRGHGDDKRGH